MTITPVQVRLREDEREALDQYRRQKLNPPTRAQAARELIRRVLIDREVVGGDAIGTKAA